MGPPSPWAREWLKGAMHASKHSEKHSEKGDQVDNPFSTKRTDAAAAIDSWRSSMDRTTQGKVTQVCETILRDLGYDLRVGPLDEGGAAVKPPMGHTQTSQHAPASSEGKATGGKVPWWKKHKTKGHFVGGGEHPHLASRKD